MALVDGQPKVIKGGIPQEKNKRIDISDEGFKEFMEAYEPLQKLEVGLHFRYATHGTLDEENTHPYKVTEGCWMMHNGVLSDFTREPDQSKSDTWHFASLIAQMVSKDWLRDDKFLKMIHLIVGAGNKLLFLDKEGFLIPNTVHWVLKDGIHYSNDYGIEQLKPPTQGYYYGNNRPPPPPSSKWDTGKFHSPEFNALMDENGGAFFLADGSRVQRLGEAGRPIVPKPSKVVVNKDVMNVNSGGYKPKNVKEVIAEARAKIPQTPEGWAKLTLTQIEELCLSEPEMVGDSIHSLLSKV